jgi:hypothetical protein
MCRCALLRGDRRELTDEDDVVNFTSPDRGVSMHREVMKNSLTGDDGFRDAGAKCRAVSGLGGVL